MPTPELPSTAYLITVTQEVPEDLRPSMDQTDPDSVINEFAKIGYVTLDNFIFQRSKLANAQGRLEGSIEVSGWIIKFYHLFDTLENANNFLNGIYQEVYDENTDLRGFELPPKSKTIEEITKEDWLLKSTIKRIVPSFNEE